MILVMEKSNENALLNFTPKKREVPYIKGIESIENARFWATRVLSKASLGVYELPEEIKEYIRTLNEILPRWGYPPLEGDF